MLRRIVLVWLLLLPLAASGRPLPATVVVRDNYDRFSSPILVSASGQRYQVCLGTCHEGDPAFGQLSAGEEFTYSIELYRMDPNRQPLPYHVKSVVLATGQHLQSVRPSGPLQRVVKWQGATFTITIQRLSNNYGSGQTVVRVAVR